MNTISSYFSSYSQSLKDEQSRSTLEKDSNLDRNEILPQSVSWAMVPYVAPIPIQTWPNIHSLFTLASLISNVAYATFPSPATLAINLAIRCTSIGFALHSQNNAKLSTNMISILAILIIKKGVMAAFASDIIFEGINFNRCKVSREKIKSQFNHFFDKPKKSPLDLSPFLDIDLPDPSIPENACQLLSVPLEKIDNQEFIDFQYNSRNKNVFARSQLRLNAKFPAMAIQHQKIIDSRDAAYKTLTERNKANSLTSKSSDAKI